MTEPRTRPRRPNHGAGGTGGTTFPPSDLSDLLYAYASPSPHLSTTISTLDEILTDFVIETCHLAALSASYSRRQKLKVEDFKFVLRHDERLLGRAMEQIWRDRRMKEKRKVDGFGEEGGGAGALEAVALEGGVGEGELKGKGKRGRRKRKRAEEGEKDEEEEEERRKKRVVSQA